ncbi:hypothetical protein HNR19_001047 [Nocardioides thalensis]|uniref:Uncharacterized protein n=1 Tax=Nocardioides thalensis TaxID=1914755 RepID=A0A853BYU6_9ACTN|nr:hypothetical protein [Nocardioides thalensis]
MHRVIADAWADVRRGTAPAALATAEAWAFGEPGAS